MIVLVTLFPQKYALAEEGAISQRQAERKSAPEKKSQEDASQPCDDKDAPLRWQSPKWRTWAISSTGTLLYLFSTKNPDKEESFL